MLLLAAATILLRLTDGTTVEGPASFSVGGNGVAKILSFHSAAPATPAEATRIKDSLAIVLADKDRAGRDAAVEQLVGIGLPVLTPLLDLYKDTDQHEPRPLYRLFERIMPSGADGLDRSLGLLRLQNGQMLRLATPTGSVKVGPR